MASVDLGMMDAAEVDRRPRPPADPVGRPVVTMKAPDADGPAFREPLQVVADRDLARRDRPGHDRPMPGHREGAVNRHPEQAGVVAVGGGFAEPGDGGFQPIDAQAGRRRRPHDLGRLQERPGRPSP